MKKSYNNTNTMMERERNQVEKLKKQQVFNENNRF